MFAFSAKQYCKMTFQDSLKYFYASEEPIDNPKFEDQLCDRHSLNSTNPPQFNECLPDSTNAENAAPAAAVKCRRPNCGTTVNILIRTGHGLHSFPRIATPACQLGCVCEILIRWISFNFNECFQIQRMPALCLSWVGNSSQKARSNSTVFSRAVQSWYFWVPQRRRCRIHSSTSSRIRLID